MIKHLFIVPREGETIVEAFDRRYSEYTNCFVYVYECKWRKTNEH